MLIYVQFSYGLSSITQVNTRCLFLVYTNGILFLYSAYIDNGVFRMYSNNYTEIFLYNFIFLISKPL